MTDDPSRLSRIWRDVMAALMVAFLLGVLWLCFAFFMAANYPRYWFGR
jgi:hypothetical protein